MEWFVGTSGYAFKEWKGPFYPEKLADAAMLGYYATKFRAVEINNTFYRMPKEKHLLDWGAQVPEGFRFAFKATQRITHYARLQDTGELIDYLAGTMAVLASKLGPILFQLPPSLKKDVPRLAAFVDRLPRGWQVAVEFRHPSWFDDEATLEVLRSRDIALCITDQDDLRTPVVATASWV
jgi:uncharacterized protein YecE (DUF72 family)